MVMPGGLAWDSCSKNDPNETVMSDEDRYALHKAKLMVLKVHLLSKQARVERCRIQTHALAGRALAYLSPPSTNKEIHRVIFYHLLRAATSNHVNDTTQDLRAVERICKLHELDHHWLYTRMTDRNDHPEEYWMGRQDVKYGFGYAALAIDYDTNEISEEDSYFFRHRTFSEIVSIHDSYDDYQAKFRLPFPEGNTDPE